MISFENNRFTVWCDDCERELISLSPGDAWDGSVGRHADVARAHGVVVTEELYKVTQWHCQECAPGQREMWG